MYFRTIDRYRLLYTPNSFQGKDHTYFRVCLEQKVVHILYTRRLSRTKRNYQDILPSFEHNFRLRQVREFDRHKEHSSDLETINILFRKDHRCLLISTFHNSMDNLHKDS